MGHDNKFMKAWREHVKNVISQTKLGYKDAMKKANSGSFGQEWNRIKEKIKSSSSSSSSYNNTKTKSRRKSSRKSKGSSSRRKSRKSKRSYGGNHKDVSPSDSPSTIAQSAAKI